MFSIPQYYRSPLASRVCSDFGLVGDEATHWRAEYERLVRRQAGMREAAKVQKEAEAAQAQAQQASPPPPRQPTWDYTPEQQAEPEKKEPGFLGSLWEGIKYWLPKK